MLRLHLLRHAKTEQVSPTGKDFDRYLMPKGERQVADLANYFQTITGIKHVLCSSAKRTRQTVEPLMRSGLPTPEFRDDLYLCSASTMLEILWGSNYEGDILIVGHNYGISELVNYLTDDDLELRTGQYVRIDFDCDSWDETSRGTGSIEEVYRPDV